MKKIDSIIRNYFEDPLTSEKTTSERFFILLNLLLPVFMGMYVFLNPLPFSGISEITFYLSLSVLLLLIVFRKTSFSLRFPLTLPFALFMIWAVIGLFFALDLKNSIHDLIYHFLAYLIIFYVLINYFDTGEKLETLSWIMIVSIVLFSVGAIVLYYFIEGHPFHAKLGKTFKTMYTGGMCIITVAPIPLILNKLYQHKTTLSRFMLGLCFLMTTVTTIMNQSRAALIGIAAALLIMCLNKKRMMIFVLIVLLLVAAIPTVRNRVMERGFQGPRIKIYHLFGELSKDHPLTGIGFGQQIYTNPQLIDLKKYNQNLPLQYQMKSNYIYNSPHNTYLDIAVRTGIIGLIFFLSIPVTAALMLWQIWRKTRSEYFRSWAVCLLASLASIVVQAMFMDLYDHSSVSFFTILAMITILWNLFRKEEAAS